MIEWWLEAERDQLPLWLPVGLGAGIGAWFGLPDAAAWRAFLGGAVAIGLVAVGAGQGGRAARAIAWFSLAAALGCALA